MSNFNNELRNYQCIPRSLVFDSTLSDRARFVYVFMSSKPDDWDFYLEPMANEIGYSVDTLRKYIKELVASGWLEKGGQVNENGTFGSVKYTLKATNFSDTEKTRHGKNPTLYKRDNNNRKDINDIYIMREAEKSGSDDVLTFDMFYDTYGYKKSRRDAERAWNRLSSKDRSDAYSAINAYKSDCQRCRRNMQYPATYLNGRTWEDDFTSTSTYDNTETNKGHSEREQHPTDSELYDRTVRLMQRRREARLNGQTTLWDGDGFSPESEP